MNQINHEMERRLSPDPSPALFKFRGAMKSFAYLCPKCKRLWRFAKEVNDCCGVQITVDGYVCTNCNKFYNRMQDALKCPSCIDDENSRLSEF